MASRPHHDDQATLRIPVAFGATHSSLKNRNHFSSPEPSRPHEPPVHASTARTTEHPADLNEFLATPSPWVARVIDCAPIANSPRLGLQKPKSGAK